MSWKKILQPPKSWEIHGGKKRKIVIGIVIFLMFFLLSPHLEDILSARQEYIAGQDPTPSLTTTPPPTASPDEQNTPYLSFTVPKDEIKLYVLKGWGELKVPVLFVDFPVKQLQLIVPHPQNNETQKSFTLYSSWVSFDVMIAGLNPAGEIIMATKPIKKIRFDNENVNNYTALSNENDSTKLTFAFQSRLTDIRKFKILITGEVLKDKLPENIRNAVGTQEIKKCTKTYYISKQDVIDMLDITIEATCWTKETYNYFRSYQSADSGTTTINPSGFKRDRSEISSEIDRSVLDNPEMGAVLYKINSDGKNINIMEWGALQITVKYDFPEEFKDLLDYYIGVRFPDPSCQPTLIYNTQSSEDKITETPINKIETIWFYKKAEFINSDSEKALVWYWDSSEKEYKGRDPKANERIWIWVPIFNEKYLEQKFRYEIYFTILYKDTEDVENKIEDNASFYITLQAGQSYRTSTETEDKCKDWLGGRGWKKIVPRGVREFFYTMCKIQQTIKGALDAVKYISSITLGGGPQATIEIARENGGSVAVAVLLGLIAYVMFILALLIFVVGLLGTNLDMAWFGAKMWIILAVFNWLQINIGRYYHKPYGIFSLISDFFGAFYHYVYMFWKDITSFHAEAWGFVAAAILILWFVMGRRSQ
ncbi:hypothetical protein DRN58_02800 [Thermococci archaeon]|nr:MAG: hypothetical protein DRN58_02800 [Thermococci archaeon]